MHPDVRQQVVEQLGRLLKAYRVLYPQDQELTGFDEFVRIPEVCTKQMHSDEQKLTPDVFEVARQAMEESIGLWEKERESAALGQKIRGELVIIWRSAANIFRHIWKDSKKGCRSFLGILMRSEKSQQ